MFRESSELSLTRPAAGMIPPWVRLVIALACAATFAAVAIGLTPLGYHPVALDIAGFQDVLTFAVTFWMLASYLPPWRMSRALRVAVLLPVAHAIVIGAVWARWRTLAGGALDPDTVTSFARELPLGLVSATGVLALAAIAWLVARRRRSEWAHALAMLALAELLLLGLWLPIASGLGGEGEAAWRLFGDLSLELPRRLAIVIAPPTVGAIGFTALALRAPARLHRLRQQIVLFVGVMFVTAVVSRVDASDLALLRYANLLPLLLAAALVAIAALVVLGATTWWHGWAAQRAFAARSRCAGTIVDDVDEPVVGLEITSWLRGPRVVQRPFAVVTSAGTLPVRGAHLIATLPLASTQLRTGECIAVLRPGDAVQVAARTRAGGDPFRTSSAPLADEVQIAPAVDERGAFASMALVMWRPCAAYLLIASALVLTALAALI